MKFDWNLHKLWIIHWKWFFKKNCFSHFLVIDWLSGHSSSRSRDVSSRCEFRVPSFVRLIIGHYFVNWLTDLLDTFNRTSPLWVIFLLKKKTNKLLFAVHLHVECLICIFRYPNLMANWCKFLQVNFIFKKKMLKWNICGFISVIGGAVWV